jgi:hypothetical protein
MLYSTWQFMVKKKMQKPVKIFFGTVGDRSISLAPPVQSCDSAPEEVSDAKAG